MCFNPNLSEEKILLRKALKSKIRDFCRENDRLALSERLCEKLALIEEFKSADVLFAYMASDLEADCSNAIRSALKMGKIVAIPRVTGPDSMDFFALKKGLPLESQLVRGAFGIGEPALDLEKIEMKSLSGKKAFVIVPGVGFTSGGKRIGHGKGYYDRWISDLRSFAEKVFLCGFCLPCQICPDIPCDDNDEKMDFVLS